MVGVLIIELLKNNEAELVLLLQMTEATRNIDKEDIDLKRQALRAQQEKISLINEEVLVLGMQNDLELKMAQERYDNEHKYSKFAIANLKTIVSRRVG